jgi:CBS domain-containing protein
MILNYARRDVVTVRAQDRAEDVAVLMERHRVSAVVVVEQGRPIGVVTDRDLALGMLFDGDPRTRTAGETMTRHPVTLREDEGFDRALELMAQQGVRRLPIVDRQGKLRGLVSLDDLLEDICGDMRVIGRLLRAQQGLAPVAQRAV